MESENWNKKCVVTFSRGTGDSQELTTRTFYFTKGCDESDVNRLVERAKSIMGNEGWNFVSSETVSQK
jgi:hypothetical protein